MPLARWPSAASISLKSCELEAETPKPRLALEMRRCDQSGDDRHGACEEPCLHPFEAFVHPFEARDLAGYAIPAR